MDLGKTRSVLITDQVAYPSSRRAEVSNERIFYLRSLDSMLGRYARQSSVFVDA